MGKGGIVGPLVRGARRVPVLLALAVAAMLLQAASAGATPRPAPRPPTQVRSNTELYWNGQLGPGQYNVPGFLPDGTLPVDPLDGYPASDPTSGFVSTTEYFAGIIHGQPTDGSPVVGLYCIDIRTDTFPNFGYALGTWDEANVPNVGYVARILDEYYPNKSLPDPSDLNLSGAATQAAIWFFSDGFVVSESDPTLRAAVVGIVDHVKAEGPVMEPTAPTLTLSPSSANGARDVLGPFTLATDATDGATVTATGGTMYSNPAGTTTLGDGTTASHVPSGEHIWLRSSGPPNSVVLQATSKATVPTGNVYLYDGNTTGYEEAQKLILATKATLTTTVQATAKFLPFGSLVVKKTILGPAAGHQGRVIISVKCDDGVSRRPFVIRAGTHAGTRSRTYRHIEAGTICSVTETANGSTTSVRVIVIGDGKEATIQPGKSVTVRIVDIYGFVPGSLVVRKTIAGPGAGIQGEVTIHTVCNGRALRPDFVIPAGAHAGDTTQTYHGIRAGSKCTVTETVDGHNNSTSVVVQGSGETVSVPAGDIVEADISDTYGLVPGQLEVNKTITGVAAGVQGPITIHTVCDGTALTPDFVIPANAPAGIQSHIYSNIPTPATCTVTETADGATSAVSVDVSGSPDTVQIAPGGSGAATITDTYGALPGSLLITKIIAGSAAGSQGPVTIHAVCNGVALSPDLVIAAGAGAGSRSQSFDGIPAGSLCTVTESADGGTATVTATVSGDGQSVTVPAGKVASAELVDAYESTPGVAPDVPTGQSGFLRVTKTIAGPAAGQQGRIAILVACGGPLHTYAFIIPAHTRAGSASRVFPNLPVGSRCTVSEAADGHTSTVRVVASGAKKATISASGGRFVHLTDTFSVRAPLPAVTG
jgi:TQXA domain-containing protein